MATQAMQIFRETALPAQASLVPYAWYVIAPSANPNHIEVYVTDSTPAPSTIARRIPTTSDIQSMIDASMAAASAQDVFVVADIAARDALSPASPVLAHVVDASGDGTVDAGGATYIYDSGNTVWIKTAEWESLGYLGCMGRYHRRPGQHSGADRRSGRERAFSQQQNSAGQYRAGCQWRSDL